MTETEPEDINDKCTSLSATVRAAEESAFLAEIEEREREDRIAFVEAVEEWRRDREAGRGEAVVIEAGGMFLDRQPVVDSDGPIILFDLDGTLYPADNGYIDNIRERIFQFMVSKGYASDREEAKNIWKPLFARYNQSLRGLRTIYPQIDEAEYWQYHRGGMEEFFGGVDHSGLRETLSSIPSRKRYVFTNCNELEARKLLGLLGIEDLFHGVFGAAFMGERCKPEPEVFEKVLEAIGEKDASSVVLFEDSLKNLATAKSLGMATVFIGGESNITAAEEGVREEDLCSAVDCVVPNLSLSSPGVVLAALCSSGSGSLSRLFSDKSDRDRGGNREGHVVGDGDRDGRVVGSGTSNRFGVDGSESYEIGFAGVEHAVEVARLINSAYAIEVGSTGLAFKNCDPEFSRVRDPLEFSDAYLEKRMIIAVSRPKPKMALSEQNSYSESEAICGSADRQTSGSIVGVIYYEVKEGGYLYFGPFAVSSRVKGRGIGKMLAQRLKDLGLSDLRDKVHSFKIRVANHRSDLLPMYERWGFKTIGEEPYPLPERLSRPTHFHVMTVPIDDLNLN